MSTNTEQMFSTQEQIIEKCRELALKIADSAEVDFFKRAEQKIKKNQHVQQLIAQIKQKQKELVAAKHIEKPGLVKKIEDELDQLQNELDNIPIVVEFKRSQLEVNDLLQLVTNVIANQVSDYVILSTGGDPLTGQTGIMPD